MAKTLSGMSYEQAQETARLALLGKYAILKSWRKVAAALGENHGLLCAIAKGKRRAPEHVLANLGITYVHTAPGRVCPEHGVVHDKVCNVRPAWLTQAVANLRALEAAQQERAK